VVKVAEQKVRGSTPKSGKIEFYRKILLAGERVPALLCDVYLLIASEIRNKNNNISRGGRRNSQPLPKQCQNII